LLPAVQAAREAARRTTCTNNLKQIVLGMLTHEDVHHHLPTGGWCYYWAGDPDQGYDRAQPGTWSYNILEYIEQGNLRRMGSGASVLDRRKALGQLISTPLPNFMCPSRRSSPLAVYSSSFTIANATTDRPLSKTDYAAVGGSVSAPGASFTFAPSAGTAAGVFTALESGSAKWPTAFSNACNGTTCIAKFIRLAEITDGSSNTLLVGEKNVDPIGIETGNDYGDNEATLVGYDWDNIRFAETILWQDRQGVYDPYRFGSSHPAGAGFGFGDGSVHWISFQVDLLTFQRQAMRADGQSAIDGTL
jgi:hypothetical protein